MNQQQQQRQRLKIKGALQRAGFEVSESENLILIKCPRYTVTCYYSDEFQHWRLTPYHEKVQRIVREAASQPNPVEATP